MALTVLTPGVSVVSNRLDEERAQNLMEEVEQMYDLIAKCAPLLRHRAFWEGSGVAFRINSPYLYHLPFYGNADEELDRPDFLMCSKASDEFKVDYVFARW